MFFGTPDIAVPTLNRLIESRHAVVGVVSQPDRRRGRGRKTSPSPVSEAALAAGLPLLRPEKVGTPDVVESIRAWQPDLGIVVAFGQFIPLSVRKLPTRGYLINAHASLLPKYRGAAPIVHAILSGESESGISVMRVEKEMDAGAVALTRTLAIGRDENALDLTERLSELAADAIAEAVEAIADDRITWTEQDHERATHAPKIERADGELDWTDPTMRLACRIRAMAPKPGATTALAGDPLRILAARPGPSAQVSAESPGSVRLDLGPPLCVATGDGWLEIRVLQRAGGKPLEAEAFLRGRAIAPGTVLGAAPDSAQQGSEER